MRKLKSVLFVFLFILSASCAGKDEVVSNNVQDAHDVQFDAESDLGQGDAIEEVEDIFVPECTDTKPCNDGNPCTVDTCLDDGTCEFVNDVTQCEDGNPCTDDSCNPNKGCVHISNENTCDDANPYTENDRCKVGTCVGTSFVKCFKNADCSILSSCVKQVTCFDGLCEATLVDCNDDNSCTNDSCEKEVGCVHINTFGLCDDGDKCKEPGECNAGKCEITGKKKICDDGNICTDDVCDQKEGCIFKVKEGKCDDGEICTVDSCDPKLGCMHIPNTKNEACLKPCATILDCEDDNPCTKESCNEQVGKCEYQSVDGESCSDGSACSENDVCYKGVCKGNPVKCDDGNPCTSNHCNDLTKCFFNDLDAIPCDDGKICTKDDTCKKGKCQGIENECNDNSPCTLDYCNEKTGECNNDHLDGQPCSDGNACTEIDLCEKDKCVPGKYPNCSDGNPCTMDLCDKVIGCYSQPHTSSVKCDDGDKCTTNDLCKDSKCVSGQKTNCNDNDVCTQDSCDPLTGSCVNTPITGGDLFCTDNNECTSDDKCIVGKCIGKQIDCTDSNPCTDETCDKTKGCIVKVLDKSACNDGNPCTTGDLCQGKDCVGVPKKCNDFNECTLDLCDTATGNCTIKYSDSVPCDDGNACTKTDKCSQGVCKGQPLICEDGNTCTEDTCDPSQGCKYPSLNLVKCDDGNLCTKNDLCNNAKCIGQAIGCNDNNPCTKDYCDQKNGQCQYVTYPDGYGCNDGETCTIGDKCTSGQCTGTFTPCDDGNPCTIDSCVPGVGCKHEKKGPGC